METITKRCADHLRDFVNNHDIKLKPTHAHELVAAFCGYKSKAAMQEDALYPVENLGQASVLVLMPSSFIERRRQCLENLPTNLPDVYTLGEELFSYLIPEVSFLGKSFASYSHFAEVLTGEYLQKHGNSMLPVNFGHFEKAQKIFSKPLYEFSPTIEKTDDVVKLTVKNRYYGSMDIDFQPIDVAMTIRLKRTAGHVGYTLLDITGQSDVGNVNRQLA